MKETSTIASEQENEACTHGKPDKAGVQANESATSTALTTRLAKQDLNPLRVFVFNVLPLV